MSSKPGGPSPAILAALEGRRAAWAEVSLDAIAHNLAVVRRRAGSGRSVLGVVKANAYGHGAPQVARRLEAEGVELLGVAFPEEGVELRRGGIRAPILVMGAAGRSQLPLMHEATLIPTVYSLASLDAILAEATGGAGPRDFHLKVDTGMGRLGILPEEVDEALDRIQRGSNLATLRGIFTTLSCSDDPADPHTAQQLARFASIVTRLRQAGLTPTHVHAANSGGIIDHPPSWLDTVRPGIMLYGIHPSDRTTRLDLLPALALKSVLALVKRVPAGTPLGYGRTFVTSRESLIGTVPAGYADGLSRRIADRGSVLVRGRRARYAGRISMDHCMVDLTEIPQAAEGDEVVMIGRQGDETISAEQMATWADTIAYEVVSRVGPRIPRLYDETGILEKTL